MELPTFAFVVDNHHQEDQAASEGCKVEASNQTGPDFAVASIRIVLVEEGLQLPMDELKHQTALVVGQVGTLMVN